MKRLPKEARKYLQDIGSKGGKAKRKLTQADRKAIGKRLAEARARKRREAGK